MHWNNIGTGAKVLLGLFGVLLVLAAIGAGCGPNRDNPNTTGDPLMGSTTTSTRAP